MTITTLPALLLVMLISARAIAAGNDVACGMLRGTSNEVAGAGFHLRDGESVDFVTDAKTVRGTLQIFTDGGVYRVYWQPHGRVERYVLANAGENSVRLIATPPQGQPAHDGSPGTSMPEQQVLSCPSL